MAGSRRPPQSTSRSESATVAHPSRDSDVVKGLQLQLADAHRDIAALQDKVCQTEELLATKVEALASSNDALQGVQSRLMDAQHANDKLRDEAVAANDALLEKSRQLAECNELLSSSSGREAELMQLSLKLIEAERSRTAAMREASEMKAAVAAATQVRCRVILPVNGSSLQA